VEAIATQRYRSQWDWVAATTIQRSLLSSLSRLVGHLVIAGNGGSSHGSVERRLADLEGMDALRRELERLLAGNVPVSAMFVISERFKARVRALAS
jgi:hypothetical protein